MFKESGIVVLNKPCGISSNSAVNKVKKALGAKKCGHLGTLDVEASGVLLVTVNNATKLFDMFLKKSKSYIAEFEFGKETDTLDASGTLLRQEDCNVQEDVLRKTCQKFVGRQMQLPPQFSAKKVGGKVAYEEARAGRAVVLQEKEIEIFEFSVLEKVRENVFKVFITCSSGTYIRSLARDVAKEMGTCAIMASLVRVACGGFSIEDSVGFENAQSGFVPAEKLFNFQRVDLQEGQAEKLLSGQKIPISSAEEMLKLFCQGKFLGLGQQKDGFLKLEIRLGDVE